MATDLQPSRRSRVVLVTLITGLGLGLDLWTKAWAWEALRGHPAWVIREGLFQLEFAFNTGSAFGFLRDASWSRAFFILVTAAALVYLGRLTWTLPTRLRAAYVAIGLIAGGALGNLHDRFVRVLDGSYGVVDFIVVYYWPGQRWPAFNIADAVLVAGVILFLLAMPKDLPKDAPKSAA